MTAADMDVSKIAEGLPTEVKLLLCQLTLESKPNDTWLDITSRFQRHPIVTMLHAENSAKLYASVTSETAPKLVTHIVSTTEPSATAGSRRSRRVDANVTPARAYELVLVSAEGLSQTCILLSKTRITELQRVLEKQRREFAALLRTLR